MKISKQMNSSIIKFTAMCAAAMISASAFAAGVNIKGNGKIITRTQSVAAYDGIKVSRAIRVVVDDRTEGDAIIKADDNVMQYVVVENDRGTLVVGFDKRVNGVSNVNVEVHIPYCGRLSSLDASSASKIEVKTPIKGDRLSVDASSAAHINFVRADVGRCEIEVSSAASVTGAVKADNCEVDTSSASKAELALLAVTCTVETSSASKVTLNGEAGAVSFDAGSASKIDAGDLVAKSASAEASSGAGISVNSSDKLDARASSGGSIRYRGSSALSVSSRASSGGSISKY